MAQNATQPGIANSWSLIAFAQAHGRMQIGDFVNEKTGEMFKSCIFTSPADQSKVFVGFSDKLGVLTPREVSAQKDELQVVQLAQSGNYKLCKQGENAWEDVDLGL